MFDGRNVLFSLAALSGWSGIWLWLLLLLLLLFAQRSRGGKQRFVPEGEKHEVGGNHTAFRSLTLEKFSFFKLFPSYPSPVFFYFQPSDGRKELLEREDKEGLCCKRSPRLKTGERNVQLARELKTLKTLSGTLDAKSLSGGDEGSMLTFCSAQEKWKAKWQGRTFLSIRFSGNSPSEADFIH